MTPRQTNRTPVLALSIVLATFVGIVIFIVGATLRDHDAPMFDPTPVTPLSDPPITTVSDTMTIDARDPERWTFFDFARLSAVYPPDTAGWDLAFRRFKVIASGSVADLGARPFEQAVDTSADAYVSTTTGVDTVNTALDRWYRYSFLTHVLTAKQHVYVTKNPDGSRAKLQFLGYYCPGMQAGCVTFRYRYDPMQTARTTP